jgi:hydroxymethylbilane synthase
MTPNSQWELLSGRIAPYTDGRYGNDRSTFELMPLSTHMLRLGTRGSLLARTQSQMIATDLETRHPGLQVELVIIKTSGDIIADKPLHDAGGKGLFTKELELALLAGEVDFAVHSYKDVPVTMPLVDGADLMIAATPTREDPRDVLALREVAEGQAPPRLAELPAGMRIGTGSLRRRCQILAKRPDLIVQPIRGNIDTRLRKLEEGLHDAVVLAMAGLHRTRLFDSSRMHILETDEMLPAPGQGMLALQCRRQDEQTIGLLRALHDAQAELCVNIERDMVARLGGDCHSPIAALATVHGDQLRLQTAVGARDGGTPVIAADVSAPLSNPGLLAVECYRLLEAQHVQALLHSNR